MPGAFVNSKYESDQGRIYRIRVQPETEAFQIGVTANARPAAAPTEEVSADVSGGNGSIGMHARSFSVKFSTVVPAGYSSGQILNVPVLTLALYNSTVIGAAGTYLGLDVEVVGKNPQRER